MPETAFGRPWLLEELLIKQVHGQTIFLLPREVIELEQRPAWADVVGGIVRLFVIHTDGAIFSDNGIVPGVDVIQYDTPGLTGGLAGVQESLQFEARGIIPLEFSFEAVDVGSGGIALHLRTHDSLGEGLPGRAGCQQDSRKDDRQASAHRLSKGFQTMPSWGWYITFSKVYSAACFALRVCAHFTRGPAAPGP